VWDDIVFLLILHALSAALGRLARLCILMRLVKTGSDVTKYLQKYKHTRHGEVQDSDLYVCVDM